MHTPRTPRLKAALLLSASALAITGCATNSSTSTGNPTSPALHSVSGTVHGGQQPVAGASIALYAAGKTGLYAAPRSMLTNPVTTDSNGQFTITGDYTCQAGDQVYVVATGGNAGGGTNNAIALMAALGPCSAFGPTTYTSVNEVTTVASVYALANFMQSVNALGANTSSQPAANALAAAFANVQTFASITTGSALQTSTGNGVVPQATINSLANSIASCINASPSSNACSTLFGDTTVPGSTPADTLQAALNIAHYPATNSANLWSLAGSTPPFLPTLATAPASYAITVLHPSDVLTYHDDVARDGVQSAETTLTPANVSSSTFGKLFTFPVDGYLFAQPLYAGGIGMPDGAVHNLVFAATTRGSVYAFDADGQNPSAGYLWNVNLIPPGERYPVSSDYGNCNNPPEAGIVGTPVIDRTSQTLYVVVKSITSTGNTFYHRLHAISLIDGSEQPNSPTIINPAFSTNGTGAGAVGAYIPFDGQTQNQRSALLLAQNPGGTGQTVWIAYASHCDIGPYHGDVLGYNAANVSQLTASYNNTPNGSDGGIWMSSGGPAADPAGNIYTLAGNGTFDGLTEFGDSAVKFALPSSGSNSTSVTVADYFTPSNQAYLQAHDLDLGGAEGIVIQDPASTVAPQLLVGSDKNGYIYLLNTANMGHYQTGHNGPDGLNGDLQDFQAASSSFLYNFAFFNNTLYTSNPLESLTFTPGGSGTAGSLNPTPTANTGLTSTAPVVSGNGTSNGIVWTLDQSNILHAYTTNLTEIYNSTQAGARDTPPTLVKFTSPIIANGKVYLSGQGALTVYGQLP